MGLFTSIGGWFILAMIALVTLGATCATIVFVRARSLRRRTLLGHYGHGMLWVYSA